MLSRISHTDTAMVPEGGTRRSNGLLESRQRSSKVLSDIDRALPVKFINIVHEPEPNRQSISSEQRPTITMNQNGIHEYYLYTT